MTTAAIAAEVAAGLAEAGTTVMLVRSSGGGSPWDENPAAPSETLTPLRAVIGRYDRRLVDGSLIRADDLRVMVEAGPVEPTTADKLRIGGVDYAIVSVRPTFYQAGAVVWEVQCRR